MKNEVRKEKWIKKKTRLTKGRDWRLEHGYDTKGVQKISASMNNWSEVDSGQPGSATDWQKRHKQRNIQLAQDIFDAYNLVQRAKNNVE